MGLEAVKEEIIKNAKKQEEQLIAEAKSEAERKMEEAEQKISKFREKSEAETKKTLDMMKRQELASAELESRKIILESKKMMVDNLFAEVRSGLEKIDSQKKEVYIRELMAKAKKEIEIGKIYCNSNDMKLIRAYDVEAIIIIGGIIAENKDGTIRVDYSFDIMLQTIRENELQNVNKCLFG